MKPWSGSVRRLRPAFVVLGGMLVFGGMLVAALPAAVGVGAAFGAEAAPGAVASLSAVASGSAERELSEIQAQIEATGATWTAGHTGVSDLTPEEKARMLGARFDEAQWREMATGTVTPADPRDLPATWDWRALGGMTSVKNQGTCGSCWCFGPTAALESMLKIYAGVDLNLSEQQLLVCSEGSQGCDGGWATLASNWLMTMGPVLETCMPYTGNDAAACVDDECDSADRIRGWSLVENTETALKTAVMIGPISVNMFAPGSFFSYTGGCFQYGGTDPINHCVCLCGWDDNACGGQGAWLIKNSWGSGWGMSGYAWVRMGDCRLGEGAVLHDYVPAPVRMAYDAVEVLDNGNHFLDAGETAQLRVTLKNFGRSAATGITAFLSTTTPGVTIVDGTASFPDVPAQGTGVSVAPHFTVQVAPGTTGTIAFDLTINSAQAANQASGFPMIVGPTETFYAADFEADAQGWTAAGNANDWRRGSLAGTKAGRPDPRGAAHGTYCFGNDLNEAGASWNTLHAVNQDGYIESPSINCSGKETVYLLYRRWLSVQKRPSDYAKLLVNGTEIWGNQPLVHFQDDAWQEVLLDISPYAADNPAVRLRFSLKSSATISFGGWNVDDVRLVVPAGNPASAPELGAARAQLEVASYPNPFRPATYFRLTVPEPGGDARIGIYDASGRLVRSLSPGHVGVGVQIVTWNGSDASGRRLPAGIYHVRVSVDGRETSSRVVML